MAWQSLLRAGGGIFRNRDYIAPDGATPPNETVLEVITATAEYFSKNKVESPRLNIEHLLAHVLGKRRMDLYMEFDRPLNDAELNPLRALVRRRAEGEPLQHLLGTAEFLSLTLLCDKRALIPRPETEQLCEILLDEAKAETCAWKKGHIVDVGTGSGCIALALAKALPEARVTAVDLSPDALALAQETLRALDCLSAWFRSERSARRRRRPDRSAGRQPPYIPSGEMAGLQREVLRDPLNALDGGPDGLVFVRRLMEQAAQMVSPGGRVALELAMDQPSILAGEIAGGVFGEVKTVKDYSGRERFFFATKA